MRFSKAAIELREEVAHRALTLLSRAVGYQGEAAFSQDIEAIDWTGGADAWMDCVEADIEAAQRPGVCDSIDGQTPRMAYQCGRMGGVNVALRAVIGLVESSNGRPLSAADVATAVVAAVVAAVTGQGGHSVDSFCPQCGPSVQVDEEGCCLACGADAMGDGADLAIAALRAAELNQGHAVKVEYQGQGLVRRRDIGHTDVCPRRCECRDEQGGGGRCIWPEDHAGAHGFEYGPNTWDADGEREDPRCWPNLASQEGDNP